MALVALVRVHGLVVVIEIERLLLHKIHGAIGVGRSLLLHVGAVGRRFEPLIGRLDRLQPLLVGPCVH